MPALTPEAWAQIRYAYEHTDRTIPDICAEHRISSGTLRDRMRRWRWTRRRPPVPREGPPACLVVEQAAAPTGTAVIVVEPALPLPHGALLRDAMLRDASLRDAPRHEAGPAPLIASLPPAESGPAPLAPALQEAFSTLMPAIQRTLTRLAQGKSHPDDAAKYARAFETLTRTLRDLSGLMGSPQRRR
jgi:hypothetical protein